MAKIGLKLESYIRDLDLKDISDILHRKYSVSYDEAESAINGLKYFFKAKAENHEELLVLPQVEDWAWHELICQTRRYEYICERIFGRYLHHAAAVLGDENEQRFLEAYRTMGIRLGKSININQSDSIRCAGWNNRSYRLRLDHNPFIDKEVVNYYAEEDAFDSKTLPSELDLDWLVNRVSYRYKISTSQSKRYVKDYESFFHSQRAGRENINITPVVDAVWCEHILWTEVYHRDCHSLFGRYFHRPSSIGYSKVERAA